jgi:hypothetical protein
MTIDEQLIKLKNEHQAMKAKLEKQRFFKEWTLMCREVEGARNLNFRLKE